jgi:hypothetical protein
VFSGQRHPSAHDDYLGIEDVQQIRYPDPEELGGVIDDIHRQLVAIVRGLIHGLRRNPREVTVDIFR